MPNLEEFSSIDRLFAKKYAVDEHQMLFLMYLMKKSREGHICVTIDSSVPDEWAESLYQGSLSHRCPWVKQQDHTFYLERCFIEETVLIHGIKQRLTLRPPLYPPRPILQLNTEQNTAVERASTASFLLISGGPGRGKSFVALEILRQFFAHNPQGSAILTAPTGKAVSHFADKLQKECFSVQTQTLHRLLACQELTYNSTHHEKSVICANLLLIDECSMIDLHLWSLLFEALSPNTRVICIGDPHQLPPIGMGAVFQDLCQCVTLPHVHLTENIRTENIQLMQTTHALIENDFRYVENLCLPLFSPRQMVKSWLSRFLPPYTDDIEPAMLLTQLNRFVILSALNKGLWGTETLNELIEKELDEIKGTWVPVPIMITKNAPSLGLFNGDIGLLLKNRIDSSQERAYFSKESYLPELLPSFDRSWCISIHKSQGSEYQEVAIVLPEGAEVFGKELLYTGMTRAKNNLLIYSSQTTINQILTKNTVRASGIQSRLTF